MPTNGTDPHGRPVELVYPSEPEDGGYNQRPKKKRPTLLERLTSAKAVLAIIGALWLMGWWASNYVGQFAKKDDVAKSSAVAGSTSNAIDLRVTALESAVTAQGRDIDWLVRAFWNQYRGAPVEPPPP